MKETEQPNFPQQAGEPAVTETNISDVQETRAGVTAEEALLPKKLIEKETGLISKFHGLARRIGLGLVLVTSLSSMPGNPREGRSEGEHKSRIERYLEKGDIEKIDLVIFSRQDPSELLEGVEHWKTEPFAMEIIEKIAESSPRAILDHAEQLLSIPVVHDLVLKLIEKKAADDSYWAVSNHQTLRFLPKGDEVFKNALYDQVKDSGIVLSLWKEYQNEPYADEIMRLAAERNPAALIHFAGDLNDRIPRPLLEKTINEIMERNPRILVMNFSNYKDVIPNAAEVLEKALRTLLKGPDAIDIIEGYPVFRDFPFAGEILRTASEHINERLLGYQMLFAFEKNKEYEKMPYYDEILEKTVRNTNGGFSDEHYYFDLYRDKPYAEEILMKNIQGGSPDDVYYLMHSFKDMPYAERVITAVLEKAPGYVFRYLDSSTLPPLPPGTLDRLIEDAIKLDPNSGLGYALEHPNYSKSDDIIHRTLPFVAAKHPSLLLNYYIYHNYGNKELCEAVEDIIPRIIQTDPMNVLYALNKNSHDLDIADRDAVKRQALFSAMNSSPSFVLTRTEMYQDESYKDELFAQALNRFPRAVVQEADHLKHVRGGKELIRSAIQTMLVTEPDTLLMWYSEWKDVPDSSVLFEEALRSHPVRGFQILQNINTDAARMIKKSQSPTAQMLKAYAEEGYEKTEGMALMDALVRGTIAISDIPKILENDEVFFEKLNNIQLQKDHLGNASVDSELKILSLRIVQRINALHEEPDEERFKAVQNVSAERIYSMTVYGEEEIFTSSFNGLFSRMLEKMKDEKIGGNELLDRVGKDQFRTFIKMATGFNRLGEFLETMDVQSQQHLLHSFVQNIEQEKEPLSHAVAIADTFSTIQDSGVLKVFQETVKEEYERVVREQSKEGVAMYGLLAGMFGEHAVVNESWLREMAERYRIPDVTHLATDELFNPDGSNIQQYFFYNDTDGQNSFKIFLKEYHKSPEWKIEDRETYVVISAKGREGTIEIYANKPDEELRGPSDIAELLEKRKMQSIVVVHRGHSYHAQRTINRVPPIAKIVSLGSCGGYRNIDQILKKAPQAHIISTKGTGTIRVNEPLFKLLNDTIRKDGEVDWPELWDAAQKKIGESEHFANYVPPHKNLGVLYLKAYYQQLQQEK